MLELLANLSGLIPEVAIGVIFTVLIISIAKIFTNAIVQITKSHEEAVQRNLVLLQKAYEDCSAAATRAHKSTAEEMAKIMEAQHIQISESFTRLNSDLEATGERISLEVVILRKEIVAGKQSRPSKK